MCICIGFIASLIGGFFTPTWQHRAYSQRELFVHRCILVHMCILMDMYVYIHIVIFSAITIMHEFVSCFRNFGI